MNISLTERERKGERERGRKKEIESKRKRESTIEKYGE